MKTSIILITCVLISACSSAPEKATSVEDYCLAVGRQADRYTAMKIDGASRGDLKAYIRITVGGRYPQREVQKMQDVVDMLYDGRDVLWIEQRCVEQRRAGTWFTALSAPLYNGA